MSCAAFAAWLVCFSISLAPFIDKGAVGGSKWSLLLPIKKRAEQRPLRYVVQHDTASALSKAYPDPPPYSTRLVASL